MIRIGIAIFLLAVVQARGPLHDMVQTEQDLEKQGWQVAHSG